MGPKLYKLSYPAACTCNIKNGLSIHEFQYSSCVTHDLSLTIDPEKYVQNLSQVFLNSW